MPISQGSAGGVPGLALKAWALVKSDGTLLKGLGVSASSRTAAGIYSLTFSNPTGSDYVLMARAGVGLVNRYLQTATAATATVHVAGKLNGTDTDATTLWEFYE